MNVSEKTIHYQQQDNLPEHDRKRLSDDWGGNLIWRLCSVCAGDTTVAPFGDAVENRSLIETHRAEPTP
jgi:hypothetical protein